MAAFMCMDVSRTKKSSFNRDFRDERLYYEFIFNAQEIGYDYFGS